MAKPPSPKTDALRAMRERKHEEQQTKSKAERIATAKKLVAKKGKKS